MQNDKILCVIGARGGSQGVPGKNIRPILGKPLIEWAIRKALEVPGIDRVVISTDSPQIADVGIAAGAEVPFMRPPELASSDAGKFQVWQHAANSCEMLDGQTYDIYVDIDCTNPLIETEDIVNAIDYFRMLKSEGKKPDAVFTVSSARRNPYFNLVEPNHEGVLKMSKSLGQTILARQRAPMVYEHVAGVYVLDRIYLKSANHLLDGRAFGYEIPAEKAFDIDSELDFTLIEFLMGKQKGL